MKTRITTILLAAAATISIAQTTLGYVTHGRWGGNNTTMRASSVSFPSGSSYRTALGTVTSRFYNNPSEFWFTQSYGDTSVGFNNGQNEVWFSSSSTYDPAVCFWWNSWWSGDIVEADVVFFNGESYTTSMSKTNSWAYQGSWRTFETTAMHEYGHAAGLSHENDEYNIMGSDWTHIHCNGSTLRSYVGEDACDGLVALYGRASGGSFEDVSVSMFEYSGASGEYSNHNICDMYTSSGGWTNNYDWFSGQKRYNVNKGSTYQVEFSFENNGETTRTVNTRFYISTNNYISTGDTAISTTSYTLGRNSVYTTKRSVTIPSNLNSGQTYYLGVIVDYTNSLGEVDESNNAAYHIIRVN